MKPYIIVHMMTSIDGRIDCPMVGQLSTDEYEVALDKFGLCSKLSGRVTAALECTAVKEESDRIGEQPVLQESIHIARSSDEYTIVVDTYGKLSWQANTSDGHPVLCIVSEQVSQTYLDTLHLLEISWIVVGKDRIDLPKAMKILHDKFGIKQVVIAGGGHICGGFLETGLIDEVSIMLAPGIDGRKGQTAVFDGITDMECNPYRLKLESLEQLKTGIVWLRYKMREQKQQ